MYRLSNVHRRLQIRTSFYETVPGKGSGLRLGIYQAQAACGKGATPKNMARLKRAVAAAKPYQVQLLSFPELYVPGYTLSPEEARQVAEFQDVPATRITPKTDFLKGGFTYPTD